MKKNDFQELEEKTAQVIPSGDLRKKLQLGRPLIVKLGLDPTSPDIHLGHTVVLRKLRQFQDLGHHVVLIVGDYTAKIGDPSGRSKTRPVLSDAEIRKNAKTYREQATKILDPDPKKLTIRLNSEWLEKLDLGDLISLMSSVTVARVLERDDFRKRLHDGEKNENEGESELGMHEILYPLLQAYDSFIIKADIELGGTDQTFNLMMGRRLQKKLGQEPQVVMTMPLIPGLDGKEKMSKSLGNYIGISESADQIYGKMMSLPDSLLKTYIEATTDLHISEAEIKSSPLETKQTLAHRIAEMYGTRDQADRAKEKFSKTFQKREFPSDAKALVLKKKITLLEFLTKEHKLFSSNSEARRKILEGAVSLNGKQVRDVNFPLEPQPGKELQLKIGKRKFYRIL